jgi:hypothetical protein
MKLAESPICQADGCNQPAVLVHHIKAAEAFPDLKMFWDNLSALCNRCHERIHAGERWGGAH